VFEAMLETLAEMVERERSADMIDSTIVRAHHCAVGTLVRTLMAWMRDEPRVCSMVRVPMIEEEDRRDGDVSLQSFVLSATRQPITHILDWFHLSMRRRHIEQAWEGIRHDVCN